MFSLLIDLLKGSPVCRNFAFVGGFQPLHKFARCIFLTKRFYANKTFTVWRANGSVLASFIELDFVAAQPEQFPKIIERMCLLEHDINITPDLISDCRAVLLFGFPFRIVLGLVGLGFVDNRQVMRSANLIRNFPQLVETCRCGLKLVTVHERH